MDSKASFSEISSIARRLDQYVMPWVRGEEKRKEGWGPANKDALEIENLINSLENSLNDQEILSYRLGILIGAWGRALIINPRYILSESSLNRLEAAFNRLKPSEGILKDIYDILEKGKKDQIGNVYLPDHLLGITRDCLYAYSG